MYRSTWLQGWGFPKESSYPRLPIWGYRVLAAELMAPCICSKIQELLSDPLRYFFLSYNWKFKYTAYRRGPLSLVSASASLMQPPPRTRKPPRKQHFIDCGTPKLDLMEVLKRYRLASHLLFWDCSTQFFSSWYNVTGLSNWWPTGCMQPKGS